MLVMTFITTCIVHDRIVDVLIRPAHKQVEHDEISRANHVHVGLTIELRPDQFRVHHYRGTHGARLAGIEYIASGAVPYASSQRTIVPIYKQERYLIKVRPYEPGLREAIRTETSSLRNDHALQHGQACPGGAALSFFIILLEIPDRVQQWTCRLRMARQDGSAQAFDQIRWGASRLTETSGCGN
jgi:hypothetical protein